MNKPPVSGPAKAPQKCACERCNCPVQVARGVERDGKLYCSETCAYDCTEQTCVCVHDRCEEGHCDH